MDLDIIYRMEQPSESPGYAGNETWQQHAGQWFVRKYPIYVVLMCASAVLGILGNILVICSVLAVKKLRSATNNKFIINLAFADVNVTGLVIPINIVGAFYGESFFASVSGLCSAIGFVCLTSCLCSLLNIGAIALNRYVCICRNANYKLIFNNRNTRLACVSLWIFSSIAVSPNFLGWGAFSFDDKQFVCAYDRLADFSYTVSFALLGIASPLLVIGICYARIYLFVRGSRRRLGSSRPSPSGSGLFSSSPAGHRALRRELATLRTFFIVFVTYALCWIPYATIVVTDWANTFPVEVHAFAVLLCHSNSAFNCVIYGLFNKQFRKAYLSLICMLHGCIRKPTGSRSSSSTGSRRFVCGRAVATSLRNANGEQAGLLTERCADVQAGGGDSDSQDT